MNTLTKMRAKILEPSAAHIRECAQALKKGFAIAIPTETVYGLAANAMDSDALTRIFLAKERPTFDPLIVHVALEKATLADLMREQVINPHDLSDQAIKRIDGLIRKFWPGPLTLVLPKNDLVPDLATAGLETVAVRMPRHPVAQALIREFGLPVCAPSANRFGRLSPTSSADVMEELGDRIDMILEGGPCEVGVESTILQVTEDGDLILLRPGGVSVEEIESVTKAKVERDASKAPLSDRRGNAQPAPGMLASHYAPKKKLHILPSKLAQMMTPPKMPYPGPKKVGLLALSGKAADHTITFSEILDTEVVCESLSENGDFGEIAKNLFKALRKLDASDAEILYCEPVTETEGLAFAVADRLKRASGPRN